MKKHKQHLIDHNTLESTAQKVDSSTAAMDRQALQSKARDDRENADSSNAQNLNNSQAAKTTPTTKPPQDSSPTTAKAAGFADDFLKKPAAATPCTAVAGFGGFQGAGEGILLGVNEQARAVESTKSAAKTTPTPRKAESQAILCACSEFVYLGSLPYTLRLPTGKTYPLHQGDSFIVPQGDLSRYLEYKSTMFKKLR